MIGHAYVSSPASHTRHVADYLDSLLIIDGQYTFISFLSPPFFRLSVALFTLRSFRFFLRTSIWLRFGISSIRRSWF